jgi:hypothetical protein
LEHCWGSTWFMTWWDYDWRLWCMAGDGSDQRIQRYTIRSLHFLLDS